MNPELPQISLGFSGQQVSAGLHICQIFADDGEQMEVLLACLRSALQAGERVSCFSDRLDPALLADTLQANGISIDRATQSGALALARSSPAYFPDGSFVPERILAAISQYAAESLAQGYPAARVIGEMPPDVQRLPGGSRLLEYEARVSLLLEQHPVSATCQYDARLFDGATLMDVLKVHPLMIVRGSVIHNPFFIPAQTFLDSLA
jgi:hypothetical protein